MILQTISVILLGLTNLKNCSVYIPIINTISVIEQYSDRYRINIKLQYFNDTHQTLDNNKFH